MPIPIRELPDLTVDQESRFWSHVDRSAGSTGCWWWTAATNSHGYGQFSVGDHFLLAHRVAFELGHARKIQRSSDGCLYTIDHLCANDAPDADLAYQRRACVNPDHLAERTQHDNVMASRAVTANNARKQYCKSGHPLFGDNVRVDVTKRGVQRACRACDRLRQRARATAEHKAARNARDRARRAAQKAA